MERSRFIPSRSSRSAGANSGGRVRVARRVLALLAAVSHRVTASCAAAAFCRPPRFARTAGEKRILEAGTATRIASPGGDLALWTWGEGPMVLLAHGWGGHAGRLSRFVPALVEAGFGVAAFDAPAHGASGGGFATLPDFVDAVRLAAGVCRPVAMIGHSMGAAACALAVRSGVRARALVLLATPSDPAIYTRRFARHLRLPTAVAESMDRSLQERYRVSFADLRLEGSGPDVPAMLFHDRGDSRVSVREARAIAGSWPCAELVETQGLGHHKILRDRAVVAKSVAFLRAHARTDGARRTGSLKRHAS